MCRSLLNGAAPVFDARHLRQSVERRVLQTPSSRTLNHFVRGCLLSLISQALALLSASSRRRFYLILVAGILAGFVEMVGTTSVLPFLAAVAAPERVLENPYLKQAYQALGCVDTQQFLFYLGFTTVLAIGVANGTGALFMFLSKEFVAQQARTLAGALFRSHLDRPYVEQIQKRAREDKLLTLGYRIAIGIYQPMILLVSRLFVIVCFLLVMLLARPALAGMVSLILGGAYALIYRLVDRVVSREGITLRAAANRRTSVVIEAISAMKEVKILGCEQHLADQFQESTNRWVHSQERTQLLSTVPRYLVETVTFGTLVVAVLFLLWRGENVATILPTLALFALSGYRMMPALQQVFSSLALIRYYRPFLSEITQDLRLATPTSSAQTACERMMLGDSITLEGVDFAYPGASETVLSGLSLSLPANRTIGVVGTTGSGKTTFVDLLMGLLSPTAGRVLIDQSPLTSENLRAWQRAIGYVPQHIFLADDSIRNNVGYGIAADQVDTARVREVLEIAQLGSFVEELPEGLETNVGERGVRLSGGQRQRIGIARAIYHDPSFIVFDEATSALDTVTEEAFLGALQSLKGRKTILIIAHRLATLSECDEILVVDQGQILARGQYRNLLETCEPFKQLAQAGAGS